LASKIALKPDKPAMNKSNTQHVIEHIATNGNGSLLLSREELISLTGTKQSARQRHWLGAREWPFVEAAGRCAYPRVARFVFEEKMRGRDPSVDRPQPRYDALDRLTGLT